MGDLKDLAVTVEELRAKKYEELPADLVHQILEIESEAVGSSKAARLIEHMVDQWLSTKDAK